MDNARALAQADLDEACRHIKRGQNAYRQALHLLRQAQAGLIGIKVETIPTHSQEAEHGNESRETAA